MTAELRSIYSGPIRRALERVEKQFLAIGGGNGGGGSLVLDPAYVGPQRDNQPTSAQFSNVALKGNQGMNIGQLGNIDIAYKTGQAFSIYESADPGTTATWVADIKAGRFQLGAIAMGDHPVWVGMFGIWDRAKPSSSEYILVYDRAANGGPRLNALAGGNVRLNVANNVVLSAEALQIFTVQPIQANFDTAHGGWDRAHFAAWATPTSSWNGARVSLHQQGYWAPQLRATQNDGPGPAVVNGDNTAYAPIYASAFTTASSSETKHDIREARSIGIERERIVVHHDPRCDVVPDTDIMALRPVAFRPNVGTIRPVPSAVEGEWDYEEWEPDTWPGLEGRRERLGLIAEEVETLIPSAVSHGAEGNVVGIDYAQITVALLAHVQRLTEEVATLRYRVAELEGAP